MQSVWQIAHEIVNREGGFVDDPDDPGRATKYGVTIHTMQRLGIDLTQDGVVDRRDVRMLNRDQAVEIFIAHYFKKPRLEMAPPVLHGSLFDMYVNAGSQSVKILQRLLVQMKFSPVVDGVMGPQTAHDCHKAAKPDPIVLRDSYGIARRNYYFRLADYRPASRKYVRSRAGGKGGWIVRAEEFVSPTYHLSQSDFEKRTATWA